MSSGSPPRLGGVRSRQAWQTSGVIPDTSRSRWLRGWNRDGRRRPRHPALERNLSAITRHYRDEGVISFLPPAQLVADWSDDGCPDPARWIEVKVVAILASEPTTPRQPREGRFCADAVRLASQHHRGGSDITMVTGKFTISAC